MIATTDFEQARARADELGHVVSATVKNFEWIYFTVEPDATPEQVRDAGFEAVHGRPMSDGERQLLAAAVQQRPGILAASLEDINA